jgi:hypothetical protein
MTSLIPTTSVVTNMPLLAVFDFANHEASAIMQNRGIYASAVVARDKAEWNRSSIGGLEAVQRDTAGFLGFNFGNAFIRRLYLSHFAPKELRSGLMQVKATPKNTFAKFLHRFEPISRYHLITTQQLQERQKLTLHSLETAFGKTSAPYKRAAALFEKMIKHHSAASFTALASSILFLSVGIQLMNMYLTYVRKQHALHHPTHPMVRVTPPQLSNITS